MKEQKNQDKVLKKSTEMKSNVDSLISGWQKELQVHEKERASMSANELKLKRIATLKHAETNQWLSRIRQTDANGYQ